MRFRSSKADKGGIHEINMTSLIDVSLVLVVVLLVATPLAFQSSILVRNTVNAGRSAQQESEVERVEIEIVSADSVVVNRNPIGRAHLASTLYPLISQSTTGSVIIRCRDGVPHGAFVSILDDAKQCGASAISIIGS